MYYILISACLFRSPSWCLSLHTFHGVHPLERLLMMRYILISARVLPKAVLNK